MITSTPLGRHVRTSATVREQASGFDAIAARARSSAPPPRLSRNPRPITPRLAPALQALGQLACPRSVRRLPARSAVVLRPRVTMETEATMPADALNCYVTSEHV